MNDKKMLNLLVSMTKIWINLLVKKGVFTPMQIAKKIFDLEQVFEEYRHNNLYGTSSDEEGYYIRFVQYTKIYLDKIDSKSMVNKKRVIIKIMLITMKHIEMDEYGYDLAMLKKRRIIYRQMILQKYKLYEKVFVLLLNNYKHAKKDDVLNQKEQIEALYNTIDLFENNIKEYADSDMKNTFLQKIINIRFILSKKKLPKAFQSHLIKSNANYILNYHENNRLFYPVIFDILNDTFRLKILENDYNKSCKFISDTRKFNQLVKVNSIKINQNIKGNIEMSDIFKKKQSIPYSIFWYSHFLECDYENFRKFYIYLTYGDIVGHNNEYKQIIGKIPVMRHAMMHYSMILF